MKRSYLFISVLIVYSFIFSKQLYGSTTISFTDCDAIEASITGVSVCNNCYRDNGTTTVFPNDYIYTMFRLYKKNGSVWNLVQTKLSNFSTVMEFTGLAAGTYRVEGRYAQMLDGTCITVYDVWGRVVGCKGGLLSAGDSNELEVGNPTVGGVLFDVSGMPGNNVFCKVDISSQGGVYLNTPSTFGETEWQISICRQEEIPGVGNCEHYTSTGWNSGQMPDIVNLLTDVWQLHHSWTFWGGEYTVQLAIKKDNCTTWLSDNVVFEVVDSGCRIGNFAENNINLFPNPTTNTIQFEGLEAYGNKDIRYNVFNVSGQLIKTDYLLSTGYPIDVHDLKAGIYVIQLDLDGQIVTKRFTVL
jgi:hypothetical protein